MSSADQYFVFRDADAVPTAFIGYGTEREAAQYLAHLNRSANHFTVRKVPDDPATIVDLELSCEVFNLADALIELEETA